MMFTFPDAGNGLEVREHWVAISWAEESRGCTPHTAGHPMAAPGVLPSLVRFPRACLTKEFAVSITFHYIIASSPQTVLFTTS